MLQQQAGCHCSISWRVLRSGESCLVLLNFISRSCRSYTGNAGHVEGGEEMSHFSTIGL